MNSPLVLTFLLFSFEKGYFRVCSLMCKTFINFKYFPSLSVFISSLLRESSRREQIKFFFFILHSNAKFSSYKLQTVIIDTISYAFINEKNEKRERNRKFNFAGWKEGILAGMSLSVMIVRFSVRWVSK